MGWCLDGGIWEFIRGGGIFFFVEIGFSEEDFEFNEGRIGFCGFGLFDLGYILSGKMFWIVGGFGSVFYFIDVGKLWKRDRGTDNVAANFYNVKF